MSFFGGGVIEAAEAGGETAAMLRSFMTSFQQAGVEPYAHLCDVLRRIASTSAARRYQDGFGGQVQNIYGEPKAQKLVAELKRELYRLKKEFKDEDQFADKQPTDSSYVQAPPRKRQ